jgi:hypothetical protein
MSDFIAKPLSFATLNGVLGKSTPAIPYSWSGGDVFLDAEKKFDQKAYLHSKLNTLLARETVIAEDQIRAMFDRTVEQNFNIMFDLSNCSSEMFEQYDRKLNLLLEAAFSHAENEHNLKNSKENIKNSQQMADGWMNFGDVNNLVRLTSTNPLKAPDPNKFVPKFRR